MLILPRYNDLIPLLPWHIVISGFHCTYLLTSYVGEGIKKLNDFLQNQSHPPTVEVAKEWKRRLTGAHGEGHESPDVCKLLDKVEFVTHRQFGARSL